MRISEIGAMKEAIFDQICDGPIPKQSIEEMFTAFMELFEELNVDFINFRNADWEAKVDELSNLVDLDAYRQRREQEKSKRNMFIGDSPEEEE